MTRRGSASLGWNGLYRMNRSGVTWRPKKSRVSLETPGAGTYNFKPRLTV